MYYLNNSLGTSNVMQSWHVNDLIAASDHKQAGVHSPIKRSSTKSKGQMSDVTMMQTNHKRTLTLDSSISKRLKSSSTTASYNATMSNAGQTMQSPYSMKMSNTIQHQQREQQQQQHQQHQQQQKSPHLLQHLMAPTPQKTRKYNGPGGRANGDNTLNDAQWNRCNGNDLNAIDNTKLQSSDSVLKNLLVSGCDISAGYVCHVPVRLKKLTKA